MGVRVRDMVIASVACKRVFRRFAQLSEEEQAEVVNRVKEKLNEKNKESVLDDNGESTVLGDNSETPDDPEEIQEPEESIEDALVQENDSGEQEDVDNQPEFIGIVDGLTKEVQQIKSDGRIDPQEVLGLFDNMMSMVTLLVNAKAPSKPRKSM